MLPAVQNRYGHELRVEVVHPMDLSKTWRGHGPGGRGERVSENPRIPRRREDEMIKDPALLPSTLSTRYLKDLKRLGVKAAFVNSLTTMPRGWDYGNITTVSVGGEPYEFKINVARGEVSGLVSKGVGMGRVIGQARGNTADEVIAQLESEALGEMRPRGAGP